MRREKDANRVKNRAKAGSREPVSTPRFGEGDLVLRAGTEEIYRILEARLTGLPAAAIWFPVYSCQRIEVRGSNGEILPACLGLAFELERQSGSGDRSASNATGLAGMPFQPVVDGHLLPQPPFDAVRAGLSSNVRVLVGTNRDEMTLFGLGEVDDNGLRRIAARIFTDADAALAAYRSEWPGASPNELFSAIMTDQVFFIPAVRLAEAQAANGGAAYQYLFTWESRAFGGRLKATHALEIPFVFNNLGRAGVDIFLGPGALPQALADAMHAAWIAFIGTDPSCDAVGDWPAYCLDDRAVMEFGTRVGLRTDPYGATRAVWQGLR